MKALLRSLKSSGKPKPSELRVALCISGQMRGYEETAPSIIKNIVEPLNADVFIHTWSEIGNSINEHRRTLPMPIPYYLSDRQLHHRPTFDSLFPEFVRTITNSETVEESKLMEIFKPKRVVIEDTPSPDEYDAFFGFGVPQKLLAAQIKSQWSRQLFYKVWKCNEFKREAEKKGKFKYDLVIRLRPDLSIGEPIPKEHLKNRDKLYFRYRTLDPSYQIADQYFYGSSSIMDSVCDTYNKIPELWNEYNSGDRHHKYYWAEGLLYSAVTRNYDLEVSPFRTEKPGEKSTFQLCSYSQKRLTYPAAKDALFKDINAMSKKDAENTSLALSRALASYVHSEIRRSKKDGAALDELSELISEFETTTKHPAPFAKSILLHAQGELEPAKKQVKLALDAEPESNEVLKHTAQIALGKGAPSDAVAYASKGLELLDEYNRDHRPGRWALFDVLGYALEDLGQYEQALNAYLGAFSLNDTRAPAAYRTGKMLYRLERYDQALWFLRQAQKLNPKHDAAAYFEAHALCKLGMYSEASALCLKFAKDASDKGGIKTKFFGPAAIALFRRGNKQEAAKYVNAYLSTGALHEDEVVELSGLLREMDRNSKAEKLAAKGSAKFLSSPYVQQSLTGRTTMAS